MFVGKFRLLLLAFSLLAVLALAGCGLSPITPDQQMEELGTQAFEDEGAPCEEVLTAADGQSPTDEEILDGDVAKSSFRSDRGTGGAAIDQGSLHIVVTWDYADVANYTFTVTITGTLVNGTTIDPSNPFTKTVTVANGAGTVAIHGALTGPGGVVYVIDIHKYLAYDTATHVVTLHVDALITKGGLEVYSKDITITLDRDDDVPRPRTLNGTVKRHKLTDPTRYVEVVFVNLVYRPALGHRDFISGGASISNQDHSLNAVLAAQADGSLFGPVTNGVGTVIGSMTVADGVVTIVIF